MSIITTLIVILVAVQHALFMILEMFFWTKPLGLKVFHQTLEDARVSEVLAGNQGLYNGFLMAGLIWALLHPDPVVSHQLKVFFLSCVLAAGAYGAYSFSFRILLIQGTPALIGLAMLLLIHPG